MSTPFHLAWFLGFRTPVWNDTWVGNEGLLWPNGDFHVDMTRELERAGFDYIMFEDSSFVSDVWGGTMEHDLKYAHHAPKHDPVLLAPILAKATKNIGIITTMSTSFYHPYLVARAVGTLDHFSNGRSGWNIVTSSEDIAAQNYGMDALPEHDERYDRATEFTEIVRRLWDSWEPDARVMDRETNTYVDYRKVHRIDYAGTYYKSRGPLNVLSSPQGRPVIAQAGGSPRGQQFAAETADVILSSSLGVDGMKRYRDEITERLVAAGRGARDARVMFIVSPVLADTDEEAEEKDRRIKAKASENAHIRLAQIGALTGIDFSTFDLDAPIPEDLATNGHQSSLANFIKHGKGRTLRELAGVNRGQSVDLVGSPETVAEKMGEIMAEVGGDGFLITGALSRRYLGEVTRGLVPALQRRGLARTEYSATTLRGNLQEF